MARDPSGWMSDVERIPFREFGHSGVAEDQMYPRAIVHHVMSGRMGGARGMALTNPVGQAPSWHFSIGRDGAIVQHISIWDTGWHCGIDQSVIPDQLVQRFRAEFGRDVNSWTVGIEHEGFSIPAYSTDGKRIDDYLYGDDHPYPEAMIQASIRVQRWVWNSCQWLLDIPAPNDRFDRFLTHAMINPRDRPNDPGAVWDNAVWARVVNGVLAQPAPARVGPETPAVPPVEPPPPQRELDVVGAVSDLRAAMDSTAAALVKLGA